MIVKSDAIIIKSMKYGDSSKIISVFSKDFGKISFLAKGAYQKKSKFAGILESLNEINATFYVKNNSDLFVISSADLINSCQNLSANLNHYAVGLLILEATSTINLNRIANEFIYENLSEILKKLKEIPANPFAFFVKMMLILAEATGYELATEMLISQEDFLFINLENGQIFKNNNLGLKQLFRIKYSIYCKFYEINNSELDMLDDYNFNSNDVNDVIRFFEFYFSYHLDKKVRFKSVFLL